QVGTSRMGKSSIQARSSLRPTQLLRDGPQIGAYRACVLAREAEGRHVAMAGRQSLPQLFVQLVDVEATADDAERWRSMMRACAGLLDGVTRGAHFGQQS